MFMRIRSCLGCLLTVSQPDLQVDDSKTHTHSSLPITYLPNCLMDASIDGPTRTSKCSQSKTDPITFLPQYLSPPVFSNQGMILPSIQLLKSVAQGILFKSFLSFIPHILSNFLILSPKYFPQILIIIVQSCQKICLSYLDVSFHVKGRPNRHSLRTLLASGQN